MLYQAWKAYVRFCRLFFFYLLKDITSDFTDRLSQTNGRRFGLRVSAHDTAKLERVLVCLQPVAQLLVEHRRSQ